MDNNTKLYDELIIMGQAFMILNEDERTVILNRFGFLGNKETLRDLAKTMLISPERVRQKQEKAIYKLSVAHDTITKNKDI